LGPCAHRAHKRADISHGGRYQALGGTAKKLIAGFRWQILNRDGSPFDCDTCTGRDMEARNCGNHLGLSEDALAVTQYTYGVTYEHREKGAKKVISLGGIRLYECPLTFITPDTWEMMRLAYMVEDSKRLLHEGEWGMQPYWLIEAVEIYKAETARQMRKDHGGTKS